MANASAGNARRRRRKLRALQQKTDGAKARVQTSYYKRAVQPNARDGVPFEENAPRGRYRKKDGKWISESPVVMSAFPRKTGDTGTNWTQARKLMLGMTPFPEENCKVYYHWKSKSQ